MVKKFKMPENCDECSKELEEYFCKCKTCEIYLCYDCLKNHSKHKVLQCENICDGWAAPIELGDGGGYGPGLDQWVLFELNEFYSNNYLTKCEHSIEYLENNKHIFICHDCRHYICLDCLKEHENHSRMLKVVVDGNMLRELDPNLYKSDIDLNTNLKIIENPNKILLLNGELDNENKESIYDIKVSIIEYFDKYGSDDKYEQDNMILEMDEMKSSNSDKFECTIIPKNINNDQISVRITYKDVYAGVTCKLIKLPVNQRI
jgi:hypothetical protein